VSPDAITQKIRLALPDAEFEGKSLIQRHRMVMNALAEEMKGPIHALTLTVKSRTEAGSEKP